MSQQAAIETARPYPPPAGARIGARFGVFTGNEVIVGTDPNHTLEGAQRVVDVPAWLVVTDHVAVQSFAGGPASQCESSLYGAQVWVVADADGHELANLSGGGFDPVR